MYKFKKSRQTNNNERKEIFFIWLFFTMLYLILFSYQKQLVLFPDEITLTQLMKNIYEHNGLQVKNVSYPYSSYLYPLVMAILYKWNDSFPVMKMIPLVNVFILSTSIVPMYQITKLLVKEKSYRIGCVCIGMTSPFFVYANTYMAESLLIPIMLWTVFFMLKTLNFPYKREETIVCSCMAGIFTYLSYMTKAVSLYLAAGYLLTTVILCIHYFRNKFKETKYSRNNRETAFIYGLNLMIYMAVFTVLFILGSRFPILQTNGSMYTDAVQGIFSAVTKEKTAYAIFAFIRNYGMMIFSTGILSFVFPIITWRVLTLQQRISYLFLVAGITAEQIIVVFMIVLNEEFGMLYGRQHLRYVESMYFPLFVLTFSILTDFIKKQKTLSQQEKKRAEKILTVILFYLCGSCWWFLDDTMQTGLSVYRVFCILLNDITPFIEKEKIWLIGKILFIMLPCMLFCISITKMRTNQSVKKYGKLLITYLTVINILNLAAGASLHYQLYHAHGEVAEVLEAFAEKITEYSKTHKGNYLVITDDETRGKLKLYDTFENCKGKQYFTTPDALSRQENQSGILNFRTDGLRMGPDIFFGSGSDIEYDVEGIDYIICLSNQIELKNVTEIAIITNTGYGLYQNKDREKFCYELNFYTDLEKGEEKTISSSSMEYVTNASWNGTDYVSTGKLRQCLTHIILSFRETGTYEITLQLDTNNDEKGYVEIIQNSFEFSKKYYFKGYQNQKIKFLVPYEKNKDAANVRIDLYSYKKGVKFHAVSIKKTAETKNR